MTVIGLLAAAAAAVLVFTSAASSSTQVCAYSAHRISSLQRFSHLVHRDIACAQVFNDTASDWAAWQKPWFLSPGKPDFAWADWAKQGGRRLVITQSLFPSAAKRGDWLARGARGAYAPHAATLARNLVAAGLGNSVIRLAPEANGDWNADSLPASRNGRRNWREFWRRTVIAMRSVPGTHFEFDWCVNAGVKPVPLASFYPGNDVVDIVGVDAYDSTAGGGWHRIFHEPDGIAAVARFARAHRKPLSIPEWGLQAGGPNAPGYVDGIAAVVRRNRTAYQAYFFAHDSAGGLMHSRRAIAAYRRHFGIRGDSVR